MLLDKERHDIDNFYVGELYITEQVEKNLFEPPKENHFDKHYKQIELIIKGAVDLQSGKYVLDDVDWGNRVRYYKVLTIFYKNNDNYLCLHDGNIYKTDTEDFVNNVVPLSSLLPKIGYNIPKRINTSKALFMFEQLFNKTILLDKIYNNAKYKIENFYVGTLVLNTEILPFGQKNRVQQVNVTSKSILAKSSRIICFSTNSLKKGQVVLERERSDKYKYIHYECLFLKVPNGLYNINDFQIYEKGLLGKETFKNRPIGESYYENIKPLSEQIGGFKGRKISIPKVLKKIRTL